MTGFQARAKKAAALFLRLPPGRPSPLQRAADGQPTDPNHWLDKSLALISSGRAAEAEASLRHLLTLQPKQLEGTVYLARLLIDRDNLAEAVSVLAPAIEVAQERLEAFTPLVMELCNRGVNEAEILLHRIAEHQPHDIIANFLMGERLASSGPPAPAATFFQRAADGQPVHSHQWLYKSLALIRLGYDNEAEASLRHLLSLEPKELGATVHLTRLLIDRERFMEAVTVLAPAIETAQDRIAALAPLAMELTIRGVKNANSHLNRIVELMSSDAKALADFAQIAYYANPDWTADYIARARTVADSPWLQVSENFLLPEAAWSEGDVERWIERFRTKVAALAVSGIRLPNPLQSIAQPPHYAAFFSGLDSRGLYVSASAAWQALCPELTWTSPHCVKWQTRPLTRRLRVGFLTQPTFPLLWGVARELNREDFEVIHLFEQTQRPTAMSPWQGVTDEKVAIPDRNVHDAQQIIANQALDILIHTPCTGLRYFLSHARLAPVQCSLCEPNYTDGVPNLDYYIGWAPAEPKNPGQHYSSPVALLTRPPYWVEQDHTKPASLGRQDFDLPQGARWYLFPGSPIKMHPKFDAVLGQILDDDPEGVLILLRGELTQTRVVEQRMRASLGAAADRLLVLSTLRADHCHALLSVADAVLDTWPLGGMSSSWAAIHAGIPTVTLPADVPFGRWLEAMYKAISVTDLIALDESDYARLAVRLANDPAWREELAIRIRSRNSVFIEDRLAVRELEAFLIAAVAAAHRGEEPRRWTEGRFLEAESNAPSGQSPTHLI